MLLKRKYQKIRKILTNSKAYLGPCQTPINKGGSRTAGTSKMELFVIIVNGRKPLTIMTKCSILDITTVLDPPLIMEAQVTNSQKPLTVFAKHPIIDV